jgi:hypothetical protein
MEKMEPFVLSPAFLLSTLIYDKDLAIVKTLGPLRTSGMEARIGRGIRGHH